MMSFFLLEKKSKERAASGDKTELGTSRATFAHHHSVSLQKRDNRVEDNQRVKKERKKMKER